MSDIELPEGPAPLGHIHDAHGNQPLSFDRGSVTWERSIACSTQNVYSAEQMHAYARAAILADREKSFQNENQAQAAQGVEYQVLGFVSRYGTEIHSTLKAAAPGQPVYIRVATEASKPVQAEAPTASNAGERIDLSQWEKARFGYFDQAGRFVEFSGEDNELPNDSSPRWVGGLHDMQLLRAALATQQEAQPCRLCGSTEPFTGTCGGGRSNPLALCYEPAQQEAQPQAEPAGGDKEDAARYRWLRDVSEPPHNFYISVPDEFHGVRYKPNEVDAYIDAARAAQQATGERG